MCCVIFWFSFCSGLLLNCSAECSPRLPWRVRWTTFKFGISANTSHNLVSNHCCMWEWLLVQPDTTSTTSTSVRCVLNRALTSNSNDLHTIYICLVCQQSTARSAFTIKWMDIQWPKLNEFTWLLALGLSPEPSFNCLTFNRNEKVCVYFWFVPLGNCWCFV